VTNQLIDITIPRDLAIQLIGSDAGKEKRCRANSAMIKRTTTEERAAVYDFMAPFHQDEIKRCHQDKSHRKKAHQAKATPQQAQALKKMCVNLVRHLKAHLARRNHDDRCYRTKQRIDQARKVIIQINTGLGLPPEDGSLLSEDIDNAVALMKVIDLTRLGVSRQTTITQTKTDSRTSLSKVFFMSGSSSLADLGCLLHQLSWLSRPREGFGDAVVAEERKVNDDKNDHDFATPRLSTALGSLTELENEQKPK
jgi:hypothetical protein